MIYDVKNSYNAVTFYAMMHTWTHIIQEKFPHNYNNKGICIISNFEHDVTYFFILHYFKLT
jgi:hypothetical protein